MAMIRTSRFELRLTVSADGRAVATVVAVPSITGVGDDAHLAIRAAKDQLRELIRRSAEFVEPVPTSAFVAIKALVDRADPKNLLRGSCPPDEYEPEVQELAARLDEAHSAAAAERLARDVFGRWFGTETARATYPPHRFDTLAEGLAALAVVVRPRGVSGQ